MKITTKCERVQPVCRGLDEKGELVWEGTAMAYWQMAMFPVRYVGDFVAHWSRARLLSAGFEFEDSPSMDISGVRPFGKRTKRPNWGD